MSFFNKLAIAAGILILSLNLFAQKNDGTYKGIFSGDSEGTFEFTVKGSGFSNLEGKIKPKNTNEKLIFGQVKTDGTIDAYFYDKRSDISSALMRGVFRGKILNKNASGNWEFYDASREKSSTSKGEWSTQTFDKDDEDSILSASYLLGNELPFNEEKPIAVRIKIRLNDKFRSRFSIEKVTMGGRNPEQGRYAPDVDSYDNFYVYTDDDGLFIIPPPKAKETNYDFQFASFGTKPNLSLPKKQIVHLYVTLKSEQGEKNREEKLDLPIEIKFLGAVLVQKCGLYGDCPTVKNEKLQKGKVVNLLSGDEMVIPLDAQVLVKFLDGTISYFANHSQTVWRLKMGAGRFNSNQYWKYTENAITIKGIIEKGTESGGGKITDKIAEEGLQLLIRKSSKLSAPGLIVQLGEFFGSGSAVGEPIAVRLRSKVSITFYSNGTYRLQNLEGSPEIKAKQGLPLLIPVGKEVLISKKGEIGELKPIQSKLPEAAVQPKLNWNGNWETKWGRMVIFQNGNQITGTYEHDNGKINGVINGNKLTGSWSEAPTYLPPNDSGEFEMILSPDGKSFTGKWRYGKAGKWETGWNGNRF